MFRIESLFHHNGYKCVVIFTGMGTRCGYVAVLPGHPLFGVPYDHDLKSAELLQELKGSTIGKRGIIEAFMWDRESTRLSTIINVHGSLTYSSSTTTGRYPTLHVDEEWYFGFDCGHLGDGKDPRLVEKYFGQDRDGSSAHWNFLDSGPCRSKEYVEQECRNLADQLECIKDILVETRVQIEE